MIEAFVSAMAGIEGWIEAHGGSLELRAEQVKGLRSRVFPVTHPGSSFPNFPRGDALGKRALVAARRDGRHNGAALWDLLAENLAGRRIPVVLDARVSR